MKFYKRNFIILDIYSIPADDLVLLCVHLLVNDFFLGKQHNMSLSSDLEKHDLDKIVGFRRKPIKQILSI